MDLSLPVVRLAGVLVLFQVSQMTLPPNNLTGEDTELQKQEWLMRLMLTWSLLEAVPHCFGDFPAGETGFTDTVMAEIPIEQALGFLRNLT